MRELQTEKKEEKKKHGKRGKGEKVGKLMGGRGGEGGEEQKPPIRFRHVSQSVGAIRTHALVSFPACKTCYCSSSEKRACRRRSRLLLLVEQHAKAMLPALPRPIPTARIIVHQSILFVLFSDSISSTEYCCRRASEGSCK